MARILLGVTGGIAAYKALEFTRLATKAGHAVRVIQTEASQRFVGTACFAGITGAPVLTSECERDPLRGAFPGDPPPAHAPLSHLELVERADVFLIAPASANTLAKLADGHADNLLTARRARLPAPADRRAGDERRDVRAPGDAGQPRRRCASAASTCSSPAPARSARPASGASAGCPSRPSCWPRSRRALGGRGRRPRRPERAGHRRRHARADRRRALRRQPLLRADGLRARRARPPRRGADVTVVAANVALPRRPASRYVDVETAAELAAACEARVRRRRRAADGRGRRRLPAAEPRRGQDQEGRGRRGARRCALERTEDVLAALAGRRRARPGAGRLRRRARRGRGRLRRATSSRASGSTPSSSTTSRSPASASTPPTTRSRS